MMNSLIIALDCNVLDIFKTYAYHTHMKRTNIFFPAVLLDRLKSISKDTGLSVAEHIRRAVDIYLKKLK